MLLLKLNITINPNKVFGNPPVQLGNVVTLQIIKSHLARCKSY